MMMNNWENIKIGKAIWFNPPTLILKGSKAKKISMRMLIEFQRKINGYEYAKYFGGSKFKNQDTLFSKITPCLENGKTAFVDLLEENEKAFGSSEFIVLRKTKFTDSKFIYYLAISPTFRKKAISSFEGTSGRKRVNSNTLQNFNLPFPLLEEQKKIANVLSNLDQKIELNNKINAELEAMAKLIYDYWFVQFDFPNSEGKPYKSSGGKMVYNAELKREIPDSWNVATLLDIATFTNGIACQKHRPNEGQDYYKVIKIREMGTGFTDKSELVSQEIHEKVIVNNGDILFSWSATLDVKIWTGGIGGLNQHIFKITSDKYPRTYYYFEILKYLQHFKMIAELRKTTMGHITQDHLKQSRISIPPSELIDNLHGKLDPIINKVVKCNEENLKFEQLRDWLLPMLMNGQVTVK